MIKITPVEKIPDLSDRIGEERCFYKNVRAYLEEFMNMDVKYAQFTCSRADYKTDRVAYRALMQSVTRAALPITVTQRGDDIYLIRRDLEGEA